MRELILLSILLMLASCNWAYFDDPDNSGVGIAGVLLELACGATSGLQQDHCYKKAAMMQNDAGPCAEIEGKSEEKGNAPKNQCYYDLAVRNKNPDLCRYMEDPTTIISVTSDRCEDAVGRAMCGERKIMHTVTKSCDCHPDYEIKVDEQCFSKGECKQNFGPDVCCNILYGEVGPCLAEYGVKKEACDRLGNEGLRGDCYFLHATSFADCEPSKVAYRHSDCVAKFASKPSECEQITTGNEYYKKQCYARFGG